MNFDYVINIDDNSTTLFFNVDLLKDYFPNSIVLSYENTEDFLDVFEDKIHAEKKTCLLLLDINMPNQYGFHLIDQLEETYPDLENIYIIMLTSSTLKSDVEKSTRFKNVIAYLEKPLSVVKLRDAIVDLK
jgi:response regulator RpfG family c-di-GMP phosphodiesterase